MADYDAAPTRCQAGCDGRHLDPSPDGFFTALRRVLSLPAIQAPQDTLLTIPNFVLFIDTYELLSPLDDRLREEFLPQLPEPALVVIAGRQPPPAAWRADHGWGNLTRIISLRNLLPQESATYLRAHGIPEEEIAHVLSVTHGHPLDLSLAADLFTQTGNCKPRLSRPPPISQRLVGYSLQGPGIQKPAVVG